MIKSIVVSDLPVEASPPDAERGLTDMARIDLENHFATTG
jgi:hypothetical protein